MPSSAKPKLKSKLETAKMNIKVNEEKETKIEELKMKVCELEEKNKSDVIKLEEKIN